MATKAIVLLVAIRPSQLYYLDDDATDVLI